MRNEKEFKPTVQFKDLVYVNIPSVHVLGIEKRDDKRRNTMGKSENEGRRKKSKSNFLW